VSCHDFRRSGISDGLDAGIDLALMQRRARHADPKTTSGYDRRGERHKREAAAKVLRRIERRCETEPSGARQRAR